MKKYIPTENEECETFADWLRFNKYQFSHLQNEQKTKNWGAIMRSKRLGVNPGVPDYLIICKNAPGLMFIEIKRTKGSVISDHQKSWLKGLLNAGAKVGLCYGVKEAIDFVVKNDN